MKGKIKMLKPNVETNYLEYCLENGYCTSENDLTKGTNKINIYPNKFESMLILHELLNELTNKGYTLVEITKTWIVAVED